jgi:hypothetical protein
MSSLIILMVSFLYSIFYILQSICWFPISQIHMRCIMESSVTTNNTPPSFSCNYSFSTVNCLCAIGNRISRYTICNCQQLPNLAGQYPDALRRIRLPLYTKVYNLWAGVFLMKILQNFIFMKCIFLHLLKSGCFLVCSEFVLFQPCRQTERTVGCWKFRFERQEFRDSLLIKLSEFSTIQLRILKEESKIYS